MIRLDDKIYKNFDGMWCRNCPACKKELPYKTKAICLVRYHKNSSCKHCFQVGCKAFWYGKRRPANTRLKMSNARIGMKLSYQTKHKLSEQKRGVKNPMYGKIPTETHREKMRIAALKRLDRQGIMVAFNPDACHFIDEYGKRNGYNFRHALNGGEECLAGFPVDGYDENKKVIFEYDEPYHCNSKRKKKDEYKQQCIIGKIHPSMFIRYDERENRLYDAMTNKNLV